MVGRGAKFQRAYASIYPSKLLIYARPSTDAKAAIRDPQLHKALRQAGHTVSIIEDWALLEQALKTVPVDAVLVDVAEAAGCSPWSRHRWRIRNRCMSPFPSSRSPRSRRTSSAG